MSKKHVFTVADDAYIETNMRTMTAEALAKNTNSKLEEVIERVAYLSDLLKNRTNFDTKGGVTSMTSAQSNWEDENKSAVKPPKLNHIAKIHPDLKSEYDG